MSHQHDEIDLIGIKIEHSESSFKENKDVILTLKDKNVLDEGEDVLENLNLIDEEKANRNLLNKCKKDNYFEESDYDIYGHFKQKSLLSKYDEEINGIKKDSFRIGFNEARRLKQIEEIKKHVQKEKGKISLEIPKYKVASEYYTEEEITAFKKPKKKKSKKKILKADDLLQLEEEESNLHLGNRKERNMIIEDEKIFNTEIVDEAFNEHQKILDEEIKNKIKKINKEKLKSTSEPLTKKIKKENGEKFEIKIKEEPVENENEVEINDVDLEIPDEEIYGTALEEDDLQIDLQQSLENARKLKQKQFVESEENLKKIVETTKILNETDEKSYSENKILFDKKNDIIINSTAEFCKNLGDVNTLKYDKDEEELLDFEKDLLEENNNEKMQIDNEDFLNLRNKWNEVDFDTEQPKTLNLIENKPILEEEPDVSQGLAGALKLAMKKGYLDKEIKKSNISAKVSSLQAKNYTIEEKFYDDDKISRRERYSGPISDFKELSHYKPDVKLEYNDDNGRELTPKEAFRVLSHKFHGKGPGKNKIDKRMKKLLQETKLKSMTSTDTPLGTSKLLQEKQKELYSPYVILSANSVDLKKKL